MAEQTQYPEGTELEKQINKRHRSGSIGRTTFSGFNHYWHFGAHGAAVQHHQRDIWPGGGAKQR